jgi:hypothetical protein
VINAFGFAFKTGCDKKENRKRRKRKEKGFRKLGEILGKLEGRGKRNFVRFFGFFRV